MNLRIQIWRFRLSYVKLQGELPPILHLYKCQWFVQLGHAALPLSMQCLQMAETDEVNWTIFRQRNEISHNLSYLIPSMRGIITYMNGGS